MTAAAPPASYQSAIAPAPPLRVELQVASVASGLLVLLDAHRLTGRLPLEVQVQLSRLRHAVKVAIQAHAEASSQSGATAPAPVVADPAAALRSWIAVQPWAQPGPQGWVYLLCFRDPATGQHRPLQGQGCRGQYAGHYWGWTPGPGPPHRPAPQSQLGGGGSAGPGGPGGRAVVRAGLV
jgi:hypothetical protein